MLKTIIQPSRWMVKFLLLLHLRLSKPQRQHLLRLSEALVVCQEPHKTLAALNRQWVETPDVSTDAHFLRQSPWSQHEMRAAVAEFHAARFDRARAGRGGRTHRLYLT